jgi:predicted MPP superfamily phosphohydrolase
LNPRMFRTLTLALVMLTASEVLILNWARLASEGAGLSLRTATAIFLVLGAINALLFPAARRRVRATGLGLFFSRSWILSSVTLLLTGLMLTTVLAAIYGTTWLFGAEASREVASVWIGGAIVVLGLGSGLWGSTVGNARVRVDRISLPIRGLPGELAGLSVVHITDLHIGPLLLPERLAKFVERINALDADLIVITGDIFDFDPDYIEQGCRGLAALSAKRGVYAVLGNHDHYTGTEKVVDGLRSHTSIRVLRDEWEAVHHEGAQLIIAGIEDPAEGWMEKNSESEALVRLAGEIPDHLPCLLLAHRPSFFDHAEKLGFSLVLSGHTHGGQIAMPFATNTNASRMISDRTRGLYRRGDSTMYVNRGLGMAGLPLRINCPREIALIELVP